MSIPAVATISVPLEDGSTVEVPTPAAALFAGMDLDGSWVGYREDPTPSLSGYFTMTKCCGATLKGSEHSETGVECRACFDTQFVVDRISTTNPPAIRRAP
jgi:hypothetical protein